MPQLPGIPPPGRAAAANPATGPGYIRRVVSLGSEDDLARILSSGSVSSAHFSPKWAATPTPTRSLGSGWGGLRLSGSPGSGTGQPQPSVGPWPSTPSPWAGGFQGTYSFEAAPTLQPVGQYPSSLQPVLLPQTGAGAAPESAPGPTQLLPGAQMMWVQMPAAPGQTAPMMMQMPVGMVGGQSIMMVAQPAPAFSGDQMAQIPSNGCVAAPVTQTNGELGSAVQALSQSTGAIPEDSKDPPPTIQQAGLQLLTEALDTKTLDNLSADGQALPSKGSALHGTGRCNPCAWFWKANKGCANEHTCDYCHLCPEGELKNRKKEKVKLIRAGVLEPQNPA